MRKVVAVTMFVLFLLIVASAAGIRISGINFVDLKRNVRIALGLPKLWVTSFNDDSSRYTQLACPHNPLVFVSGGQSNAANAYDPAPPADHNQNTYMFFSGKCYKLQSPVLGSTGEQDSLWPALGNKINLLTGRSVVFINGAVGGTQLGDFLDTRSHYFERLSSQIAWAEKIGLRPTVVIWIQGETDAAVKLDPDTYVKEQKSLINSFDSAGVTDRRTRWLLALSTRCLHRTTNGIEIESALIQLASHSNERVVLGPRITGYDDEYRHDTCHLNTRGRDRLVDETYQILLNNMMLE